jgi:hypothetical protein
MKQTKNAFLGLEEIHTTPDCNFYTVKVISLLTLSFHVTFISHWVITTTGGKSGTRASPNSLTVFHVHFLRLAHSRGGDYWFTLTSLNLRADGQWLVKYAHDSEPPCRRSLTRDWSDTIRISFVPRDSNQGLSRIKSDSFPLSHIILHTSCFIFRRFRLRILILRFLSLPLYIFLILGLGWVASGSVAADSLCLP